MNQLYVGGTVRLAVRTANTALILYGTVLGVAARSADTVGTSGEPAITVAFMKTDAAERILGGPAWSDVFRREVGVMHCTHAAAVAGHNSIVWVDTMPAASTALGDGMAALNALDYFPDLAQAAVADVDDDTPALPASTTASTDIVPAATTVSPTNVVAAEMPEAVVDGVEGVQSSASVVHVATTGGERINKRIDALAVDNVLVDLNLKVTKVEVADGKLHIATEPAGAAPVAPEETAPVISVANEQTAGATV